MARSIYAEIGGKSPLLDRTNRQASALEQKLRSKDHDVRVFVCMRYWHPMSAEVAASVAEYSPDDVVLLPLYPQFSTTTTASSFKDWRRAAEKANIVATERAICCYPVNAGFIAAQTELIQEALAIAGKQGRPRVLFSAHGLPERIVARGDPYPWQVEQTTAAVVDALGIDDLDHVVCYQSRVGPLKWIGPDTEAELERAGRDGVPVVLAPISFVSEHSETLVELDITYRDLAARHGVNTYVRVPAVGTTEAFIEGLADLVNTSLNRQPSPKAIARPQDSNRFCPVMASGCPCPSSS